MDLHNPHVLGTLTIPKAPEGDTEAVRLIDLKNFLAGVSKAKVYVTDVVPTSTGIVANKVYAPTTPANRILLSAISDTKNVRVKVLAEGDLWTAPSVTINDVAVTNWSATSVENRFEGYVDLTLNATADITVKSATGGSTSVRVVIATEGPVIQSANIGALPGQQTEVKSGDVLNITGIVANEAVSVTVADAGAASSGSITAFGADNSGGQGFKTFSGTFTVSGRSGAQSVSLSAKNSLGTAGATVNTLNTVTLNQTYPAIGTITVSYPNGQGALRIGDTASVAAAITNADSATYTLAGGTVADPSVLANTKQATATSGTYSVGNNYTITAVKASNGASSTKQAAVRIAETAASATITIQNNPARLRSSADGEIYVVQVAANQLLSGTPDVTTSAGTFEGSWSFTGGVYRRNLRVKDSDPRGPFTISGTISNLALRSSNVSQQFTIGGNPERTITFPAFARFAAIGTNVGDITKTRARYSGTTSDLARRTDTTNVAASFTIVDENGLYNPNGGYLFLNDEAYANSNTSGTLKVLFEETA